jgi:hypothetical protein
MTIKYVGDIHGNLEAIQEIEDDLQVDDVVVQVGDLGIGFYKDCPVIAYFQSYRPFGPTWLTCGGNHDNWDLLKPTQHRYFNLNWAPFISSWGRLHWVHRGSTVVIEDIRHLFFGGARSYDKHHRTAGRDWWEAEEPTYDEWNTFADGFNVRPDVVVTHDCPSFVPIETCKDQSDPMRCQMTKLFDMTDSKKRPYLWASGHHHVNGKQYYKNNDTDITSFLSLGINECSSFNSISQMRDL